MTSKSINGWIAIGTVAAALFVALGCAATAIADRSTALASLEQLRTESIDHEARLRIMEAAVPEIRLDVKWIRLEMERRNVALSAP